MRKALQIGLVAVAAWAASASTALAESAPWTPNPGASYANGVVTLDNAGGAGTSYENANLDVAVANGDTISFEYFSEDATCAGGTPRVFIQGGAFNTFDQDPNNVTDEPACGVAIGDGWHRVTVTVSGIVDGTAGHTGIVNDNPADPGTVLVRNLTIGGVAVALGAESPAQAPTSKGECKKGGWRHGPYKNQGQCVSHFAKAKRGGKGGRHGAPSKGHGHKAHGHKAHGHKAHGKGKAKA